MTQFRQDAAGLFITCALLLLSGCVPPEPEPNLLAPNEAQMKIRSVQTRTFEQRDRTHTVRAVIAALQDLGFIIERANDALGLVTAARFAEPNFYDVLSVTVIVRPEGLTADSQSVSRSTTDVPGRMAVRVNAIYNNRPIEDPKVYQNFFATLERSLFIAQSERPTATSPDQPSKLTAQ